MSDARTRSTAPPLIEAKLRPPTLRPGLVPRRRLLRALDAQPVAPIVAIICAPGYGKTTLLAQWAATVRHPVAWLTLDALDNDPAVLLAYLAAAIDRLRPAGRPPTILPAPSPERALATAVPRLAAAMHEVTVPAALVLDDVHRLVDRTALDAVAALLDHLPPRFRVAISGRAQPALPFARFRVGGALLEITPAQLALDEREARALTGAVGWRLDDEAARELVTRTEGWAAGIYLAAHARATGAVARGSAAAVSGQDAPIAEFLRSEYQAALADEDVTLLTRTSILERVDPATAEAVSGVGGAASRLGALARDHRLIQDLGGPGPVYRYHHLLREFLQAELERREPGATPALHLRAAAAHETAGAHEAAVEHAMASRDVDAAARAVAAVSLAAFYAGHAATIERWLATFGDRDLARHPVLAVIAGWIHLLRGRPVAAEQAAAIVERASFDGVPGDGTASFASGRGMLRAIMGRGGPAGVLREATVAAEQEQPGSLWRANAIWLQGCGHRLLGDTAAADDRFVDAVAAGARAGATAMVALTMRAAFALDRGRVDDAAELIAEGVATLERAAFHDIVAALIVHAVAARIAARRGDLAGAREALVRAQLVRPLASEAAPWFSVDALLHVARAYLAVGDPGGARDVVRQADQIARRRPDLGVLAGELAAIRERLADAAATLGGSSTLTPAELRLLPLLPTYLSYQEIADRFGLSRNTVKTQAMSVFGKLQASSRGEAVERAVELGLLEPFPELAGAARSHD